MVKKLALLTLLQLANALPSHRSIPDILAQIKGQRHQQDHAHGELTLTEEHGASNQDGEAKYEDIDELYFDQLLDHFPSKKNDSSSSSSASTFKQRYFYSSRYVAKPTSPSAEAVAKQPHLININNSQQQRRKSLAFLCVGGEGPALSKPVLLDSVHCSGDMIALAQKLYEEMNVDVHLFALEHRYYGESFPPQTQSTKTNLRGADEEDSEEDDEGMESFEVDYTYLSSRQAVEDIANFVTSPTIQQKHLTKKDTTSTNNDDDASNNIQWITFGGSYPGMLSAWSHLLHPSSIFASVSNSAPIEARLDFEQYHEHVGKALQEHDVGGSQECFDIVQEGHEQIVSILDNGNKDGILSETKGGDSDDDDDGLDQLAELFNVCDGGEALRKSKRNQSSFVGDGVIRIPAQGNDPSCVGELCNIRGLCNTITTEKHMNSKQSSMEILASISKLQSKGSCKEADWNAYLDYFKVPVKYNANDRSWFYQTCNEFGFYQTCNQDSTCPYGKGYHTIEQDLEFCQVIFGIDADKVRTNVESTLTYYGGWDLTPNTGEHKVGPSPKLGEDGSLVYGQKRIISVTGTVDPWTELALTGDKANADHPSVSVPGASHHFWTHKVKDSDDIHVVQARNAIDDAVIDWLGLRNDVVSVTAF